VTRDRFLLVLGQDPTEWARRYGLEPFTVPCHACGRELTTSVPFFYGQLRGLLTPTCECGAENRPYCLVRDPAYGDLFTGGSGEKGD
jgi:hypothetical protein